MPRLRQCAILILVFVLCNFALAQTYSIRVQFDTNLREEASLDSPVLQSAPAGSILQVVGSFGRWLNISRDGSSLWMADWVNYSRVDSSAPAASQSANVSPTNVDNCCFVDRQCQSEADWADGYWAYQNGQCAAPVSSQPQPAPQAQLPVQSISPAPAQVDNCCFVDRQCQSEADWADGYWAYQNGQCAAPVSSQPQPAPQTPAQPLSNVPAGVDNCCQVDRQCQSEWDWEQGYYAYLAGHCRVAVAARSTGPAWTPTMPAEVYRLLQNPSGDPFNNCCFMHHDTCHSSGDWERGNRDYRNHVCIHPAPIPTRPPVEGPPHFIFWMDKAFELIARAAPEWLDYIYSSGLRKIVMLPTTGGTGFVNVTWAFAFAYEEGENPDGMPSYDQYFGMTGVLVHEACHAIQQRTYTQSASVRNELSCLEAQVAVLKAIDPGHRWVDAIQWHIDNIHDPSTWWW